MGWVGFVDNDELVIGDDGFDIIGEAIIKLRRIYLKEIGREPYMEEILETLRFVSHEIKYYDEPYID